MSDAPAAVAPPVHEEPLDLTKFQAQPPASVAPPQPVPVVLPFPMDPDLRRMLLYIGLTIHSQLVRTNKLPEDISTLLGLSEDQVDSVLLGRNPDLKIGTMFRIAKIIGAQLQMQFIVPQPEQPKAAV